MDCPTCRQLMKGWLHLCPWEVGAVGSDMLALSFEPVMESPFHFCRKVWWGMPRPVGQTGWVQTPTL